MPSLPTRRLPRTGHALTTLGLGGAPLGNLYNAVTEADARATVQAAWAAGVRYFDTAPFYGCTLGEHRFGDALRELAQGLPRDAWVLSSKVGRLLKPRPRDAVPRLVPVGETAWQRPLPFEVVYDYSAAGIRRSVEDSLQRLGTNHIDLALVHDIGRYQHGEQQAQHWAALTGARAAVGTGADRGGFRELEQLKREGLIGAIGLGVNEWQVVADAMRRIELDCTLLAGRYTLLEQASLEPFLADCVQRGVAIVVGGPFNSGILAAGVQGPSAVARFDYAAAAPEVVARVRRLQAVCASFGVPLAAAALQFPLAHPAVVSVVPGARSVEELHGILGWLQHPIPDALWPALRGQGLLDARAPAPSEGTAAAASPAEGPG